MKHQKVIKRINNIHNYKNNGKYALMKRCYNKCHLLMLLLLLLATSPQGLYELWGCGVTTSDIDHSGPRLRRLLLCILLIGPSPPSPTSVQCPASPYVVFCPTSAWDHSPTQASPVSVPEYQKTSPAFTSPVTYRYRLLLFSSLTPITTSGFPSLTLPHCFRNIF